MQDRRVVPAAEPHPAPVATGRQLLKGAVRLPVRRRHPLEATLGDAPLEALAGRLDRPLRVAVTRFDGIGDWVLTIPLIEALQRSESVGSVTLVGLPSHAGLMRRGDLRYVDTDVRTVHAAGTGSRLALRQALATSVLTQARVRRLGRAERGSYDLVVLPRWESDAGLNARSWAVGTGAPLAGHDPRSPLLAPRNERREHAILDIVTSSTDRSAHEMIHLQALVRSLGLSWPDAEAYGAGFFGVRSPVAPGRLEDGGLVVVHPTAARGNRRWPAARWRQLTDGLLHDHRDLEIVLVGGPSDRAVHEEIARHRGGRVRSTIGAIPFERLPDLMAQGVAFVGSDSGPAHIASSLGLPVVVVSPHPRDGDTRHPNSPTRYRPWSARSVVLQPPTATRPCGPACEADEAHCILHIDVPEVRSALSALLAPSAPVAGA